MARKRDTAEKNDAKKEAAELILKATSTAKGIIDTARLAALEASETANKIIERVRLEATKTLGQDSTILKELSEIKSSLAVNTNETGNIKTSIEEIKTTVKEIKEDYPNRREFNEALKLLKNDIKPIQKFVYAIITFFGVAILGAIANLIIVKT